MDPGDGSGPERRLPVIQYTAPRDDGHPDQRHRGVKNVAAGFCFASVLCHFRHVRGIADG